MCMFHVPAVFMLKHAYLWEDLLGLFAPGGKYKALIWAPGAEAVWDACAEHVLMRPDENRQIHVSDNSVKKYYYLDAVSHSGWSAPLGNANGTADKTRWEQLLGPFK